MAAKCEKCGLSTEGFKGHPYLTCGLHTLCWRCGKALVNEHHMSILPYPSTEGLCDPCIDHWYFADTFSDETFQFVVGRSMKFRELFSKEFGNLDEPGSDFAVLLFDELRKSEAKADKLRARNVALRATIVESEKKAALKETSISDMQQTIDTLQSENELLLSPASKKVQTMMRTLRQRDCAIYRLKADLRTKREKEKSVLGELRRQDTEIDVLTADLHTHREKVKNMLDRLEERDATIGCLKSDLRAKEEKMERGGELMDLSQFVHGTFRCQFCYEFGATVVQCGSCRNTVACEDCFAGFLLSGRPVCPLDRTTDLADEKNRVVLCLPPGVVDVAAITNRILYGNKNVANPGSSQVGTGI